ncbi:MAG TPA: hypothetical protein VMT69_17270 [Kineosporiaceae bacterium]|nr:hypothetical protein [Kineosporiaceae bacterium]
MTSATPTRPLPTTPRHSQPRRRRPVVVAVLVLVLLVAGGGLAWWHGSIGTMTLRPHCTATALGRTTEVSPEQAGNAAIIAAVAVRRSLPGRAATIGIAAALQESKLVNLPGGDRDSIGLFQQRPSQGWGTPQQIRDPVYATNAFYDVLVKVEGYQNLAITAAAQTVQRSAFPSAYADREPEARILASTLTGYSPAGLSCVLPSAGAATTAAPDAAGLTPRARAVVAAASRETGRIGAAVPGAPGTVRFTLTGATGPTQAWALAQWAVARGQDLDVVSVETDGRRWDRDRPDRTWTPTSGAAGPGVVVIRTANGG